MSIDLNLNVFGDSYTTPGFCVDPRDSFWGLMAQAIGVDAICNYSHPGFSLDHIIHILLNETFDFEKDYFCIGIPPLVRYAGYNDISNRVWCCNKIPGDFSDQEATEIKCLKNTMILNFRDMFNNSELLDKFNTEWHDVQSLEKIFLLAQYLKSNSAKFLILNLSKPVHFQDLWPAGKNIMKKVSTIRECIMFDDTYYSVNYQDKIQPVDYDDHGWAGHHGSNGNGNWYNKIIKSKMIDLGWINA